MLNIFNKRLRSSNGYTVVETLIASAVLMSVLVPATLFLGKITMNRMGRDLIVASQLAQEEMEKTTTFKLYTDDVKELRLDKKNWLIKREIEEWLGLIKINVQVFRDKKPDPVVELKTLRISE
jgi:hypothetical protein